MRAENVVLPQNGYFGISAATGGLADDHDVLKFSVTSLRSLDEAKNLAVDPEFQKNQDEFEEYEKKLKTQNLRTTEFLADYIQPNKLKLTLKLPDKLNWIVHSGIMSQKA